MNVIDLVVTEVVGNVYKLSTIPDRFFIEVKATAYGSESEHTLMFSDESKASEVKIGHTFQA